MNDEYDREEQVSFVVRQTMDGDRNGRLRFRGNLNSGLR
jgi:hypothetical protein